MPNKQYRSANNRTIDMDTLRLKNEDVRAVGNMNVNARGDRLDSSNKTVDSRNKRISRQYKKQTNVVDQPISDSIEDAKKNIADAQENIQEKPEQFEEFDDLDVVSEINETNIQETLDNESEKDESQGLAAAIARAREVKQEETVPPRKAAQQKPGVKKI